MTRTEWDEAYRVARYYQLNRYVPKRSGDFPTSDFASDLRFAVRSIDWLNKPDPLTIPAFTKVTITRADGSETIQWRRNKR